MTGWANEFRMISLPNAISAENLPIRTRTAGTRDATCCSYNVMRAGNHTRDAVRMPVRISLTCPKNNRRNCAKASAKAIWFSTSQDDARCLSQGFCRIVDPGFMSIFPMPGLPGSSFLRHRFLRVEMAGQSVVHIIRCNAR